MNSSDRFYMDTFFAFLATFLSLAAPLPAVPQPGHPNDGLKLTVQLDRNQPGDPTGPRFKVELKNAGESDLILNLGFMLANGKKQFPNAIVLLLTDSHGNVSKFELTGPAGIAGRVDPLVVPLPVGSTFSIPVQFENYWVPASKEFEYKWKPGAYSLEAQFTGKNVSQQEANLDVKGFALLPYWMGSTSSNRLQFEWPVK